MTRTSEPDFEEGTLNPYVINWNEIQPGDRLGYKIIVVINPYIKSWGAWRGPTTWTDDRVAQVGDAISEEAAKALFPMMAAIGRFYYV